jgi:hypothetical protein
MSPDVNARGDFEKRDRRVCNKIRQEPLAMFCLVRYSASDNNISSFFPPRHQIPLLRLTPLILLISMNGFKNLQAVRMVFRVSMATARACNWESRL